MKHYVISDPHGFYNETIKALSDAGYFDEKGECRLVVIGDLLDRGDQANEMVEFMMEQNRLGKLVYVIGNHEDLLVDALQTVASGNVKKVSDQSTHHYRNGTWHTLLQLSRMTDEEANAYPMELARRVMDHDFYNRLLYCTVDYYETPNYIFTHGYIPADTYGHNPILAAKYIPDWRDASPGKWRMARWLNGMEMNHKFKIKEPGKTVVCGHWHTSYGHANIEGKGTEFGSDADLSPFYGDGIIAIDARTASSKRVNCIIIED